MQPLLVTLRKGNVRQVVHRFLASRYPPEAPRCPNAPAPVAPRSPVGRSGPWVAAYRQSGCGNVPVRGCRSQRRQQCHGPAPCPNSTALPVIWGMQGTSYCRGTDPSLCVLISTYSSTQVQTDRMPAPAHTCGTSSLRAPCHFHAHETWQTLCCNIVEFHTPRSETWAQPKNAHRSSAICSRHPPGTYALRRFAPHCNVRGKPARVNLTNAVRHKQFTPC